MVSITVDTNLDGWERVGQSKDARLTVATGQTIVAGQYVQYDGTVAQHVRAVQNDATAGFAGVALTGGAAGAVINVRQVGWLITTVNKNVGVGDAGTVMHADASGTASNNVKDTLDTAQDNLPVGKINRVEVTGTQNTNRVVLQIEADGFR